MQGNELCLKAQHMAYSGTWCLNKIQPHLCDSRVVFVFETVFTQLVQRGERCAPLHASQAAEPTKQCVH